jgi:hypothetical protein
MRDWALEFTKTLKLQTHHMGVVNSMPGLVD